MTIPLAARSELAPAQGRLATLEGLRWIVLVVMLFHFNQLAAPIATAGEHVYRFLISFSYEAMDLFFVLSGFLITGILLDTRGSESYYRNFYVRRFLRIFPVYYGFLALWLWVLPRVMPPSAFLEAARERQIYYWTYTCNLKAILPAGYHGAWGLLHFWSLALEEQFYLAWPAVVALCSPRLLPRVCWALVCGSEAVRVLLLVLRPDVPDAGYSFTLAHCDSLALGALIAVAVRRPGGRSALPGRVGLAALFCLAVRSGVYFGTGALDPSRPLTLLVAQPASSLLGACILIGVLRAPPGSRTARALSHAATRTLGRFSYAAYVIHVPVMIVLERLAWVRFPFFRAATGNRLLAQAGYSLTLSAVTFALAAISWHLLEAPILRLKRFVPYAFERDSGPARARGPAGVDLASPKE